MTRKEVRQQLKADAREKMSGNWLYLVLVTLPAVMFSWIGDRAFNRFDALSAVNNVSSMDVHEFSNTFGDGSLFNLTTPSMMSFGDGTAMGILAFFAATAATYSLLDYSRAEKKLPHPFLQAIEAYKTKGLFAGTIAVAVLQLIRTVLWTFVFIIPGIIKSFSYSQAFCVLKDAKANGEDIRYRDAITRSRELMDGHKWEYFVLQLSFLGWSILAYLVLGLGMIILLPYMYLTYAGYYDYLKKDLAEKNAAESVTE